MFGFVQKLWRFMFGFVTKFCRFMFGFVQKNAILCLDLCKKIINFAENQKLKKTSKCLHETL